LELSEWIARSGGLDERDEAARAVRGLVLAVRGVAGGGMGSRVTTDGVGCHPDLVDSQRAGVSAEERVWGAVSAEARRVLETGLAPTDLQTLLMAVARVRAGKVSAARVLRRWGEDRFVRPSVSDPRLLAQIEAVLWRLLPDRFVGVDLSPVAPLGICSALGPVDQHRVVSTVRGTEVLSDPTNVLAVEAAARRRGQDVEGRVDLAACHRVLRAQRFGPGNAAHFRLFALTSSARDRGSGRTEAQLVIDHISFWQRVLAEVLPTVATRITVTVFGSRVLAERLDDTIRPAVAAGPVPVVEDRVRSHGAGYYAGMAIGLRSEAGERSVDLGDGGLTTWTRQLLGDAKERCLISCVATERLAALIEQHG
jgi:hypothetical protein